MKVNSYYPVICVLDVHRAAEFYQTHLGFKPIFQNDWYIHLQHPDNQSVNLAFVDCNHDSIPKSHRKPAQGTLLNFELDNIDALYKNCRQQKLDILLELRDEPWGQRHFILTDNAGIMIDIIKLIQPSPEYQQQYQ
ncbi:VOC family protein [Planctomycetota bacterium]|nr:VOC family protein [Planctomycetota bacterium]